MPAKITRDVLESYLRCKYKGHLKLTSQQGTKCDYENLLAETRAEVRLAAIDRILARHPEEEIPRNIPLTTSALKQGASFLLDATLQDDSVSLAFDGLKKVDGPSKLGEFHYIPMLFHEGEKVHKEQKLLLDIYGFFLSRLQGNVTNSGLIWHGRECRAMRVRLAANQRKTERIVRELMETANSESLPRLSLNDHCTVCEFRQRCRAQAEREDNLTLLRGITEKEVTRQARRGIFTVTQLSYTFRARRKSKRAETVGSPHHFALQARSIRDDLVHIHGNWILPHTEITAYFDIEGIPDREFQYLIGLVIVQGTNETSYSFWADSERDQEAIFIKFIDTISQYDTYTLFHFGSYEAKALRHIKGRLPGPYKSLLERILDNCINILSVIHPHVYFPTYTNRLKDIAAYLGCQWTDERASGVQSIVWRYAWERQPDEAHKSRLIQYNAEDCQALKKVVGFIIAVSRPIVANNQEGMQTPRIVNTAEFQPDPGRAPVRWKAEFALPDFEYANKCAYFDYQRDKVFIRTNRNLKKNRESSKRTRRRSRRVTKRVEVKLKRCLLCGSKRIRTLTEMTKQVIDLRFFRSGVKRCVTEFLSWRHQCDKCGKDFIPPEVFPNAPKYGHSLICWCVYQNVVCGQNLLRVQKELREVFDISLPEQQLYRFKTAVAECYKTTYQAILEDILKGSFLHADETEVTLRKGKGYVWVFTNMEKVYYFFKSTREGSFLKDMLNSFAGVLISDFYAAYDSVKCRQQKCLLHLMRDFNEDLRRNPFDGEFRELTQHFASLLRSTVETIDKYGLRKRHLGKHGHDVQKFMRMVKAKDYVSEVAQGYQKRLEKYEGKLFTFLDYDGIPWNNNNAEHAVKVFARHRRFADGRFTEESLKEYLVMLSLYQSCEYQEKNFLEFLLSKDGCATANFASGKRVKRVEAQQGE